MSIFASSCRLYLPYALAPAPSAASSMLYCPNRSICAPLFIGTECLSVPLNPSDVVSWHRSTSVPARFNAHPDPVHEHAVSLPARALRLPYLTFASPAARVAPPGTPSP